MDTLREFRLALRLLVHNRSVTFLAIFAIAVGIGPTTVIFSAVNGLLLRPMPFDPHQRVVVLEEVFPAKAGSGGRKVSFPTFLDWRHEDQVFEDMASFNNAGLSLTGPDNSERIQGIRSTASFFKVMGFQTLLGRFFTPEEDQPGGEKVVVLSHALWKRRFGADPNLVGRSILLDGENHRVLGILSEGSEYENIEAWTPLAADEAGAPRSNRFLIVMARLKPNVTLSRAKASMATVAQRVGTEYPTTDGGARISVRPLRDWLLADGREALLILSAAVGFVLLISCVNVATLLLSKSVARRKEIALRSVLGAGRLRLIRQLLIESVVLALAGSLLGLFLAYWGIRFLRAAVPFPLPNYFRIELDATALAFTLVVAGVCGVLFGLAPIFQSFRQPQLEQELRTETRSTTSLGRKRLRNAFVISQVALALVLLISAAILVTGFNRLRYMDPGFSPASVLTLRLSLPESKYKDDASIAAFYDQLLARTTTLPGVESSAVVQSLPLGRVGRGSDITFMVENRPAAAPLELPVGYGQTVSSDYFHTLGVPIIKGRSFNSADIAGKPGAVIISQRLADQLWPSENPLGKRLRVVEPEEGDWATVVGVAGNVREKQFDEDAGLSIYFPHLQRPQRTTNLVIKTAANPLSFADSIQKTVHSLDPHLPVYNLATMEQVIDDSLYILRTSAWLLGIFAGVALVLASVGIFGVTSYGVSQRKQEIGIRMALGASYGDILRLMLKEEMRLVLFGLGGGLALAVVLARFMSSLLYGLDATNVTVFAGITVVFAAIGLAAIYLPARHVTKIDPSLSLRAQ